MYQGSKSKENFYQINESSEKLFFNQKEIQVCYGKAVDFGKVAQLYSEKKGVNLYEVGNRIKNLEKNHVFL